MKGRTHKVEDDLTVRMRLEDDVGANFLSQRDVIVNFSVDGEDEGTIVVDQRLSAGVFGNKVLKNKNKRIRRQAILPTPTMASRS